MEELPKPGFKRVDSFALAKALQIRVRDDVLHPMCGRETFLVEEATFWPDAICEGIDASSDQLQDAQMNVNAAKARVDLLQGDARDLRHIKDSSIDWILRCRPFGRQFGTPDEIPELYKLL